MLPAGEEEMVNEGKLWKGTFNFKYSMNDAKQASYFTKKLFFQHMVAQELQVSEML